MADAGKQTCALTETCGAMLGIVSNEARGLGVVIENPGSEIVVGSGVVPPTNMSDSRDLGVRTGKNIVGDADNTAPD